MSVYSLLKRWGRANRTIILKGLGIPFLICLFLAALPQINSYAAKDGGGQQLTEPESWVLGQVTQGREADLKKGFGEEERKRRLSAGFLENLLTGGLQTRAGPSSGGKDCTCHY